MKLDQLIHNLDIINISGMMDIEIKDIVHDSRKAVDDSVFVAIDGFNVDGHSYIEEAISRGAKVIIVEKIIKEYDGITVIKVKDTRVALAWVSSMFYGHPSRKLNLIGVTGTNAKTTTTYLVKAIFEGVNKKTGIIGTLGNIVDGNGLMKSSNTTPESLELQKSFDTMIKSDVDTCVMEVSSHSLELNRVAYCDFNVGIFTNLTTDHLDYHKTLENYLDAKAKLFSKTNKYNIINMDDEYGREIIERVKELETPLLTYGIEEKADIFATEITCYADSVKFQLNTPKGTIDIHMKIPGLFSVYNSLAAAASGYAYDISLEDIKKGLESVKGVKGRFEIVPTNRDFTVIIDFAHTPDALEKVLKAVDQFAEGRKVVLFGAGGDRDRSKRSIMGEIVANNCDLCIVTSDNPRTEEPLNIMNDILDGVRKANGNYVSIVDRKEAIKYAIENSQPKDVILLAGKGHETYTIIGNNIFPFDEREIVLDILENL